MKKEQAGSKGRSSAADHRAEQRNQKQNQAAQLSAANVEESPHMDKRDSGGGTGQSLGNAQASRQPGESLRRGALDTQYGTDSSKTGSAGRASSGGSGASSGKDVAPAAPNPGSSEDSSGTDRDTMSGPRPGSGS